MSINGLYLHFYNIVYVKSLFVFFIFILLVKRNNRNKSDYIVDTTEINRIKKCFTFTRRVTCSRNSNKIYIKKRKSYPHILLLSEYNHNYLDFPLIKNCIYLIAIITEPNMFNERNIFRKIYSSYSYVSYVFVMGKSNSSYTNLYITKEMDKYRDIIQFNFLASYFTLVLQTYNILLWSYKIKVHFKWLIKHDTDTFFNIKSIYNLQYINKYEKIQNIWGYIVGNFPSGMGYMIPYKIINTLIEATKLDINRNYYGFGEDEYIGLLAYRSNISLFDIRKLNKSVSRDGYCYIDVVDKYVLIHRLMPVEIYYLHNIKMV